jgi:hypothetical protein
LHQGNRKKISKLYDELHNKVRKTNRFDELRGASHFIHEKKANCSTGQFAQYGNLAWQEKACRLGNCINYFGNKVANPKI